MAGVNLNERPKVGALQSFPNVRNWVRIAFHRPLKSTGAAGDL